MLTPAINFCDNRSLFFLQNCEPRGKYKDASVRGQQYLRTPGSDAAADDVIGTSMKRCIQSHLTHLNQRPLRPLKLLQTKTALSPASDGGPVANIVTGPPWKGASIDISHTLISGPSHHLSPVSTTPAKNFSPDINDTGDHRKSVTRKVTCKDTKSQINNTS